MLKRMAITDQYIKQNDDPEQSWMAPSSDGTRIYNIKLDPETGKTIDDKTHEEWIEKYQKWVEENHNFQLNDNPENTSSYGIISDHNWIRRSAYGNQIAYTISPKPPWSIIKAIENDIEKTIIKRGGQSTGNITFSIDIFKSPTEIRPMIQFSDKDFIDADGKLANVIRHRRISQMIPSQMLKLAAALDSIGQHDVADRLDTIENRMVKTAEMSSEQEKRIRHFLRLYEVYRRSIIPRAISMNEALSDSPNPEQAVNDVFEIWNEINNVPSNSNDVMKWIKTGEDPLREGDKYKDPARSYLELTVNWALEDYVMSLLPPHIGEKALTHHSPIDRNRQVRWYGADMPRARNLLEKIEADFRSVSPSYDDVNLYEYKQTFNKKGPLSIRKTNSIPPHPKLDDRHSLIANSLHGLGGIWGDQVSIPYTPTQFYHVPWDNVRSGKDTGRAYVFQPQVDAFAASRPLKPEGVKNFAYDTHYAPSERNGPPIWQAEALDWFRRTPEFDS